MKQIIIITLMALILIACENSHTANGNKSKNAPIAEKQMNISILLDLSDRIKPSINPNGKIYDIENIKTITELFKSNMNRMGAYNAKGKIRVFFSPTPSNGDINDIVSNLNLDCSKMDNKGRKKVYDEITGLYSENLEKIYSETISSSEWLGSDIWRFFKDDVDLCVERDTNYRNILIILTDGYLFHQQTMFNQQNRFTYLLGNSNLSSYRKMNWQELVEKNDFGIISEKRNLKDLEVLVLEVKAEKTSNKIDEDVLRYLWKKWFKEMNVSHYEVYQSDLPANTKTRIESFFNI